MLKMTMISDLHSIHSFFYKKPLAKPKPPGAGSVPSQGLKKLWVSVRGEFCRLGRCFLVSVPRAEPVDAPMQSERKGGGWRAPRDAM